MNVLKHMEAVFVVALAAIGTAGYAAHAMPQADAQSRLQPATSIATPTQMAVVTVSAKRLTPAEKLRLLLAERAARGRA